jgi:hypothetical protein
MTHNRFALVVGLCVLVPLIAKARFSAWFNSRTQRLYAEANARSAQQTKEWAQRKAAREISAHEAALEREERHRREIVATCGGPGQAVRSDVRLSIREMLRQLALVCVPAVSQVTARVDRFTEFDVVIVLARDASLSELSEWARCVLAQSAPYLYGLRFVRHDAVVGELDRRAIESVTDWSIAPLATVQERLVSMSAGAAQRSTNPSFMPSPVAASNEDQSDDAYRVQRATEAFNSSAAQNDAAFNGLLSLLNGATDLKQFRTQGQIREKRQQLQIAFEQFESAKRFLSNPSASYEALLRQQEIDPIFIQAATRDFRQRKFAAQQHMRRVLLAVDRQQSSVLEYLAVMEEQWGFWQTKPRSQMIEFETPDAQDAYRTAADQVQAAQAELEVALSDWNNAASQAP